MRILIVGENRGYEDLIRATSAGKQCRINFMGYQEALEISFSAPLVFVEAKVGDPLGFNVGRTILRHFPETNLIFLMKECLFEYSMAAMRMGAKNILVDQEINPESMEQLLERYGDLKEDVGREAADRNFERMIFRHNDGEERDWSIRALNDIFGMKDGEKSFYVMIVTSLTFVQNQLKEDPMSRKVSCERVKERLRQYRGPFFSIPFVFYVDQQFYMVVLCREDGLPEEPKKRIELLQERIYGEGLEVLGEDQMILSSGEKEDFRQFGECLDELEQMKESMHCGSYPYMVSRYNNSIKNRSRKREQNPDEWIETGRKALEIMEAGGEYEAQIRKLFSLESMEEITFSQFMKVKKSMAFELESFYKRMQGEITDGRQVEEELEKLQPYCNYIYAREQILKIASMLTERCVKRYHPLVAQCIRRISETYASDISLQEMADQLNISSVYLSSLFRKETGEKFSAYVNQYRLQKAKLLIDGGQPLNMVFEAVGFLNQQYFSNCFKKAYGMTPSEYKNRMQGRNL
ncbi:MAG: AraC family transcriptional regulator [Roseburia sp.]|nr:AraC family transcriptional regulator [Roseburia sp.]MCM1096680.1 AraC family transcriptional regulator [Ruminococcus flavefaciens]